MSTMIQPVILCGGSGSRLWPLSRVNFPKPFINLVGTETLFQQALTRVTGSGLAAPLVVCAEAQRFLVLEQAVLDGAPARLAGVMLEPVARNTAPACLMAALWAQAEHGDDTVLAFLPADHVIPDGAGFQALLQRGAALAAQGKVVLFGITPSGPHGEYGYIIGESGDAESGLRVRRFVEKPGVEGAEKLIAAGGACWNSGIFMCRADVLIGELEKYRPALVKAARTAQDGTKVETNFSSPLIRLPAEFAECPNEPIDKALHEETELAVMLPFSGRWNDVGNWDAVLDELPLDTQQNSFEGTVVAQKVTGSLVKGLVDGKPVAVVGLDNVVVVDTPDALVVASRKHAAGIKEIVAALAERPEVQDHRRVLRPWGWYETLQRGPGFLVKRILVKPGATLSLQYHHHRSEHWVVVVGHATVTRGEETLVLDPDQSTYIPQGMAHRLANSGSAPVEIIEVQTGTVLEESDIVRLEDVYGRAEAAK